jgi:DNA polymerase-3 subunit beta
MVEFSATDNHLFFQVAGRLLISRKLTGNFPDYDRVLPKEHPHSVTLRREELRQAIDRVSQFADDRSHAVRVRIEPGEVKVHSSLSDTGESEDSLGAAYSGPAVEIGFNAVYVSEFLKASAEPNVLFLFKDAATAGELRPAAAEGEAVAYSYRYIIMPMRI